MNIAQYIGVFLLRYEYCYLPGIGSLQIKKRSAAYDAEQQKMNAPQFEVVFSTRAGSIDDTFANFIANNERISIAHAANLFKDFCIEAKTLLKDGENVSIPGIGYFHTTPKGEVAFTTDENLSIKGKAVPFFKISPNAGKTIEKPLADIIDNTNISEPKAGESIVMKPPQVNWGKIVLFAGVFLVVLAGVAYFVLNPPTTTQLPASEQQESAPDIARSSLEEPQAPADEQEPTSSEPETPTEQKGEELVINSYPSLERAHKRVAQLKSYGHAVELRTTDSANFLVVLPVTEPDIDRAHLVDSLTRLFGTKVYWLQ